MPASRIALWSAVTAFALAAGVSHAQYRVYQSLNADKAAAIWTFTPLLQYNQDNGPGKAAIVPSAPAPITVPSYWSDCNPDWDDDWQPTTSARNKWIEKADYTRSFDIPASMAGKRIKLRFGDVGHSCEVRVNNTLAGAKHYQGTVPFEYDITGLVAAPSNGNALKVTVWDHNDLRNSGDPLKYDYPFGHLIVADKMSGIAQDVTLYAVPKVYVKDVYVVTTVSNMQIRVEATIANEDSIGHTVSLENDILEIAGLNPETTSLSRTLNQVGTTVVAAGTQQVVTLTSAWPAAKLWWPHSPQLYRLVTRLKESGSTLDEKTDTRFGFREFKIDPGTGNRYNLNGLPFHGRGNTINFMIANVYSHREAIEYVIDQYKAFGCNLIRHGAAVPPPPVMYDVCDEKGMLCIEEFYYNGQNRFPGGVWPEITQAALYTGDPAFEQHVDDMARALVMRDRNHPSIVIWNIENEIFYGIPATETEKNNVGRVRTVIEALDLTRPVGTDHDGSLDGRLAIKNKHYVGTVNDLNDNFNAKTFGDWYPQLSGTDIYWSLGANPPSVPFGLGEFHWLKVAQPNNWANMYNPYNWGRLRAMMVRGYRLFGMSDIRPFVLEHDTLNTGWYQRSTRNSHMAMRKSMSAVAVFDHDYDALNPITLHNGSTQTYNWPLVNEGSLNTRRYDVYNDDVEDTATNITVNWEVRLFDQVTDSGSQSVNVPLSEWRNINIGWTAPQVNANTNFVVVVEAVKNGKRRFTDYRIFRSVNTGGTPVVNPPATYRNSFDGSRQTGFREHDTFWNIAGGVYDQPSPFGLYASYRPFRDEPSGLVVYPQPGPITTNYHTSAIEPWTFGDFKASFDVKLENIDQSVVWDPWAGMGFRLREPEDNPGGWSDADLSRQSGYYVGVRRLTSTGQYQTFIAYDDTVFPYLHDVAVRNHTLAATEFVRLEVEVAANVINVKSSGVRNPFSWTDTGSLYSSGYATLLTGFRTGGVFDNVQVGAAPFAPWWDGVNNPAQAPAGAPVLLRWSAAVGATEYMVEWSADGFQTIAGSTGWTSALQWTFNGLPSGALSFRAYSRDSGNQASAPSWDWNVAVGPVSTKAGPGWLKY